LRYAIIIKQTSKATVL